MEEAARLAEEFAGREGSSAASASALLASLDTLERISLLEESGAPVQTDMRALVETVMRDTQKGRSPEWIARHVHADPALIEQIARLYVTHPGVTSDGILTKMGL